MNGSAWPRRGGIFLLLVVAVLYWATLDNGLRPGELEGGDLITHQYAQVQARPSNAPGYPLYTMGGWLWFHGLRALFNSVGITPNPVSLLSSYSTLWALVSLSLLYQILRRLTRSPVRPDGDWPVALLLTGFYAVTYFFWYYATTTEQYTSAIAHTLAILYVYLRWRDQSDKSARGSNLILLFLAFLCGLSFAHMITVAVIVPALLIAVLWQEPKLLRRPPLIIGALVAAALPLLSYIYIYARGAAHPEWWGVGDWATAWEWFWSFVRTSQGQEELGWGLQPGAAFFANGFPEAIWQELSLPILGVGLVGVGMLDKRLRLVLWGTLALYALLCWVDRFGNWFQVILPAYPLILMGVAAIIQRFDGRIVHMGRLARKSEETDISVRPRHRYDVRNSSLALLAVLILWRGLASLPAADSRDRPGDTALVRPAQLLAQSLPADGAFFAAKDDALGLDYLITIGGVRSDLRAVDKREASARLLVGEPVLVTKDAAGLLLGELVGIAPQIQSWSADWIELLPPQAALGREPAVLLDQSVGDGIVLHGYSITGCSLEVDRCGMDVLLFWSVQAEATPSDWSVSLRVEGEGHVSQQDSPGPVTGLRPFSTIEPGQIVVDGYRLDAGAGANELLLILYREIEGGFENLAEERLTIFTPRQ